MLKTSEMPKIEVEPVSHKNRFCPICNGKTNSKKAENRAQKPAMTLGIGLVLKSVGDYTRLCSRAYHLTLRLRHCVYWPTEAP